MFKGRRLNWKAPLPLEDCTADKQLRCLTGGRRCQQTTRTGRTRPDRTFFGIRPELGTGTGWRQDPDRTGPHRILRPEHIRNRIVARSMAASILKPARAGQDFSQNRTGPEFQNRICLAAGQSRTGPEHPWDKARRGHGQPPPRSAPQRPISAGPETTDSRPEGPRNLPVKQPTNQTLPCGLRRISRNFAEFR